MLQPPSIVFPDQRDPASAYRVAHELLIQRDPAQALEILEPALELEPDNYGLRSLRAWAWFIRVQLDKAREELERLVEIDPTDSWVRFMLGRVHERQSNYDAALPHLRLAAVMSGDPEHELSVLRVERLSSSM
ncbi:tetratricopeptide repeat protein [Nocardioides sp. Bht2]|uniref:tetratricopeptide repeat protein n=1 Tax=Nocardioides sp. Bht2 TaxID=3392297 RepID=UPI0039B49904